MSEIRTHEQVVGIVCTLAAEAHNDCEQEREEYGTQTRQAMRWLEDTDLALRAALAEAEEREEQLHQTNERLAALIVDTEDKLAEAEKELDCALAGASIHAAEHRKERDARAEAVGVLREAVEMIHNAESPLSYARAGDFMRRALARLDEVPR